MCDYFWQRMEKGQGDLTDIFQGSGLAGPVPTSANTTTITADTCWQPPLDPAVAIPFLADGFQENFNGIKDPMLHELAGTGFFGYTEKLAESKSRSSMATTGVKPPPPPPLVELTDAGKISGGVTIPVPRAQGIKRRKNQARKVVCIPAPAAASNKPGGEVVPSDLWAWRKYGQKPIKGSPFPRGYYRCSSSKGCSARKQVERSRTDPNMLVITYTSDHNHPWPTQRNALAGSTRSQSNSKSNTNASSSKTSSINQKLVPVENVSTREEEEEEEQEVEEEEEAQGSPISSSLPSVKENENNTVLEHFHHDFNQVIHKSFNELEPDDFFADLAVLEASPMSLDEEKSNNKAMDPFNMFGWDGGNSS